MTATAPEIHSKLRTMADESIRTNMQTIQLCTQKLLNPAENESNIRHFRHVIESLKTDIRQMNELKKKWN